MQVLIESKNRKDLNIIRQLAERLGVSVIDVAENDNSSKADHYENRPEDGLFKLMSEKAKEGGIKSIQDPMEWQKSIRQDRNINPQPKK
jgi:hypothetical protein